MSEPAIPRAIRRKRRRRRRYVRFFIFLLLLAGGAVATHVYYKPLPDLYGEISTDLGKWYADWQSGEEDEKNGGNNGVGGVESPLRDSQLPPNEDSKSYDLALEHCHKGEAYYHDQEYKLARGEFDLTLDIHSEMEDAYYFRGLSNLELDYVDEAINDLSEFINRNKLRDEAYFYRGRAYQIRNEMDKACSDFKRAYDLGEDEAATFLNTDCGYLIKEKREF